MAGIETTTPDLRRRKPGVCLTEQPKPLELQPKCGDILFFAHFTVHAACKNIRDTPRLALRSRW